jgi:hypothetical protein
VTDAACQNKDMPNCMMIFESAPNIINRTCCNNTPPVMRKIKLILVISVILNVDLDYFSAVFKNIYSHANIKISNLSIILPIILQQL